MTKFTSEGQEINIEKLSGDETNWLTIQQQSFTIDKNKFILDTFNKFYSESDLTDFDDVKDVCNRSSYLRDWYAKTCLLYAQCIQLPVFLKNILSAPAYEGIAYKLKAYNDIIAEKSKEVQKLSEKFDSDRKIIEDKYSKLSKSITSDKIVRILTMSIEDLPIMLQLEINNYKPKDDLSAPTRTGYGRELLVNYQRSLVKIVLDNENVNIESIISDMRSK